MSSYTLKFTNQAVDTVGKQPIALPIGAQDSTSTSITLTGKGAPNYGKLQQESLLHLLENFASPTAPDKPTVGQIWYDSINLVIKVFIDSAPPTWKSLGGVQVTDVGQVPAHAALGDLWFEKVGPGTGFLYTYTGVGRYPLSDSSLGGWEQVWPNVTTYAGREEYNEVRRLLDMLLGGGSSYCGAGAISRNITNLTDFATLDNQLRLKMVSLGMPAITAEGQVTEQAESPSTFHFLDSGSPGDGYIGSTLPVSGSGAAGSIYIGGVSTVLPYGGLGHTVVAEDSWILFDPTKILYNEGTTALNNYYLVVTNKNGKWYLDNNTTTLVEFTPKSNMFIIGKISASFDTNIFPVDKYAQIWATAVPLVGSTYAHYLVEPVAQDWDTLLAAVRYAVNRLELPVSYVDAVAKLPFVDDGQAAPSSLTSLAATDIRYPSAARLAGRISAVIRQLSGFGETLNALNTSVTNRFSLKGINGSTGTNTAFSSNIEYIDHVLSTTAGMSATAMKRSATELGQGVVSVDLNFTNHDEMYRFMGSGGVIQTEVTHTGGSLAGDTNLATLLTQSGTWRISADKTRVFGQSQPLTITRTIKPLGLLNSGSSAGVAQVLDLVTNNGATLSVSLLRISNLKLRMTISINAGSATAGTTSVQIKIIRDGETYLPGPTKVFPKPLPFVPADLVSSLS